MKRFAFALVLLSSLAAWGQCGRRNDYVANGLGQAVSYAPVYVEPGLTQTTVYSSAACSASNRISQQLTTNGYGYAVAYLAPGAYTFTHSSPQIQTQTLPGRNALYGNSVGSIPSNQTSAQTMASPLVAPQASDIFYVPSGASDYGAAINTILSTKCPVDDGGYQQCQINLPHCNGCNWGTSVLVTSPGVSIVGQGRYSSVFTCPVNGDCLRIYTSPFSVQPAGTYRGFSLRGTGTPNGVGIHVGELDQATFEDIEVQSFTGTSGICMWMDNNHSHTYTENVLATGVHLSNCSRLLAFTNESGTGSFGYNRFLDLKLNTDGTSGETAIYIGAGSQVYSSTIRATLNANFTQNFTANVFQIAGTGVFAGELHLFGEGWPTNIFNTASGSMLSLGGDSSITWGTIGTQGANFYPASTILGTANWSHGANQVATGFELTPAYFGISPTFFEPTFVGLNDTIDNDSPILPTESIPNTIYAATTSARWRLIATLPASGSATADGIDIRECGGFATSIKTCARFNFVNRGGFAYSYNTSMGNSTGTGLQVYEVSGAGSQANIYQYISASNQYNEAEAQVLAAFGGASVVNTNAILTSAPSGTLVFDSTTPGTYPANDPLTSGPLIVNGNISNSHGTAIPSTATGNTGAPSGLVSLVPAAEAFGYTTLSRGVSSAQSTTAACKPSATCIYSFTNCGINSSTAVGTLEVTGVTVGTSFTITSVNPASGAMQTNDNSHVCWRIN